jgi:hypothetical protein
LKSVMSVGFSLFYKCITFRRVNISFGAVDKSGLKVAPSGVL